MPTDRDPLLAHLSAQREHVLAGVAGLSDEQLRRPVLPSGWSVLGLLRHLTLGDERYWFHTVVGGEELDYWPDKVDSSERPADWFVGDEESADDVVREYRDAIARSDEILAVVALDDAPRRPEPDWADRDLFPDVRSILVHVLVDTTTHAGHLDAARELIDGRQHLVLPA